MAQFAMMDSPEGNKKTQQQPMYYVIGAIGGTYAYVNDVNELILQSSKKDSTKYHILNYVLFDISTSSFKSHQLASAISVELPNGSIARTKVGGKIQLNGRDWDILAVQQFPKGVVISDGKTTLKAIHGERLSDDPNSPLYKYYTTIATAESFSGTWTDPKSGGPEKIYIQLGGDSDLSEGGQYKFPPPFEASFTFVAMAQTEKKSVEIDSGTFTGMLVQKDDGSTYTIPQFKGLVLYPKDHGMRFTTDKFQGDADNPITEAWIDPNNGNVYYAQPGIHLPFREANNLTIVGDNNGKDANFPISFMSYS